MKFLYAFFSAVAFLFLLVTMIGRAQNNPAASGVTDRAELNFYEVQKQFYEQYGSSTADNKYLKEDEQESREAGIYQQFKRWEWFMKPRVYPSGKFPDPQILFTEFKRYQSSHPNFYAKPQTPNLKLQTPNQTQMANWTPIGPDFVPSDGGGMGRINCMAFDPVNSNIIYTGAACGGLWKTTDDGVTWSSNTDFLPSLSIADIAINPLNTDIIYIATGDKYGIYSSYETTGHYSAGVLKSTDGGTTWNPAGSSYGQETQRLIQRLIINPVNPDILLMGDKYGIWRSTNGGLTWGNPLSGVFYDLEFNPLNPNVVFAVTNNTTYRSNNGGQNWTKILSPVGNSGRHSIAVTPADTSVVYIWCAGNQLYRSVNGGVTYNLVSSPNSYTLPYGYYDNVIAVSPVDANEIYAGGLNVAKSSDGGSTWTPLTDWNSWPATNYVHADCHDIQYLPGSGTTIYTCNDGGIFRTPDAGTNWVDISGGLGITEFYRFANAQQDPALIYAGAQDNGTDRFNGISWRQVYGADGMEAMIDYSNANNVYVSYQSGTLLKSTNGGGNFSPIGPNANGDWTTPFVMHPTNPQILFGGYGELYKSSNGGQTWAPLTSNQTGNGYINALAVAQSDPNYIYFSTSGTIFGTTNGGGTWTNITAGLPALAITYIAVSSADPNKVWITMSGYIAGYKVYKTTDGGTSWTNVSGTLPNIPANCIVFEDNSNDGVYIGTDMGVFYTDATMSDWISFNDGLPNVIIDELEIQYSVGKLRAATYGRGIWESDLYSKLVGINPVTNNGKEFTLYPNPSAGIFNLALSNNLTQLSIKVYDAIGNVVKEINVDNSSAERIIPVDLSSAANGIYFLKVQGNKMDRLEKVFVMK